MAKLVLHIGSPRTGSTYLQHWLKRNVSGLQEQGWSYPEFIDNGNHKSLALIFEGKMNQYYEFMGLGSAEALETEKQLWTDGLSAHVKPDSKFIITSEFFTQCASLRSQVDPLVEFLREFFDEIHVVSFARRQEYFMPSMYSQSVKAGNQFAWDWEFVMKWAHLVDIEATHELWSSTDGISSVTMIPFLESSKRDSQLVLQQFSNVAGFSIDEGWVNAPSLKSNRSLSAEGLAFLWAINSYFPRINPDGSSNRRLRAALRDRIMDLTPGPTFNPADDLIERIHRHFAASNAALVGKVPADPAWDEWLAQPNYGDAPQQSVPELAATRTAELMIAASTPEGPVDWSKPDKQPAQPLPTSGKKQRQARQRARQKLRRRLGRSDPS